MALLFKSETDRADLWRSAFAKADPKLDFRQWPDVGDPGDIDFALVWHPIKGDLKRYPNLKAIFSLGAGIEHIFSDPELPKHIPVVLTATCRRPDSSARMSASDDSRAANTRNSSPQLAWSRRPASVR